MDNTWHKITEQDIERVPKARISNPTLNTAIQEAAKEILRISKNRTDGYQYDEVAIILNKDGGMLVKIKGYNGYIDCNSDEYVYNICGSKENTLIFIHNHPNNSPVSINDIINMMVDSAIVCTVAVSNSGDIYYVYKLYDDKLFYRNIAYKMYSYIEQNKNKNGVTELDIKEKLRKYVELNSNKFRVHFGFSKKRRV